MGHTVSKGIGWTASPIVPVRLRRAVFLAATAFPLFASLLIATAQAPTTPRRIDVIDLHHLPLGDGKVSSEPRRNYVNSCQTSFHGGGAQREGAWIHHDSIRGDTWDLSQKISVEGRVTWPQASFRITTEGSDRVVSRVLKGNGLPIDTPTGTFPVGYADPAFQIDRNPNTIAATDILLTLLLHPQPAATSSCVPMGMIGVALNGVAIFNALDAGGRDAVAHEVLDLCNGHPQQEGQYHYHGPSPCLPNQTANETLIGYALDGFGIYSLYDATGKELTDADLDKCHGRTSEVLWDGGRVSMYHYVLTREYPYTIGCFRGTPAKVADTHKGPNGRRRGPPPGGGPGFGPPPGGGPPN